MNIFTRIKLLRLVLAGIAGTTDIDIQTAKEFAVKRLQEDDNAAKEFCPLFSVESMTTAMEWGFRHCEKGNNLEHAHIEFAKFFQGAATETMEQRKTEPLQPLEQLRRCSTALLLAEIAKKEGQPADTVNAKLFNELYSVFKNRVM